jgi:SEC-C motif
VKDVGRNDPCPCGSGKKFKRCCLGRNSPSSAFTRNERQAALGELFHFADRAEFASEHAVAQLAFWADRLERLGPEEVERTAGLDQSRGAYTEWFSVDFELSSGRTLLELFLERHRARLRSGELRYLERMRLSHLRPYEVATVRIDDGLDLVDLWTGGRLRVRERLATRQLVQWDVIAARVVLGEDGVPVMDGLLYLYPVNLKEPLLTALRRAYRQFRRRSRTAGLPAFFKRMGPLYHHLWLDHVVLRPLPKFLTPEGDDFIFARATFDVRDGHALMAALGRHPDLRRQDDGSYVWLDRPRRSPKTVKTPPRARETYTLESRSYTEPGRGRRALGTFVLERERLVFQATSRPRAERGRRFLEDVAGDAVRYRATSFEAVERAMERTTPVPRETPGEIPPELQARVAADFHEQHYRKWPDTPLPALAGQTPREAAGKPATRGKIIALLKQMENLAARQRQDGRAAYDFGWMWAELGLERPG